MQITIRHQISVALGEGVSRAVQHLLLTPQSSSVQKVREWQVEVEGLDEPTGFLDAYGNRALLASQSRPPAEIVISVTGLVETQDRAGVVGRIVGEPVPALFRRKSPLAKPVDGTVSRFRSAPKTGRDRIPLLHALMDRVGEVLAPDAATQVQSQSQQSDGQSQSQSQSSQSPAPQAVASPTEMAHAFIGAARALEIPARFVSGYYLSESEDSPGLHAWAEAWDDGLGWIAFDPSLALCPTDRHIRLATGLDALAATPVRSVPTIGALTDLVLEMTGSQ